MNKFNQSISSHSYLTISFLLLVTVLLLDSCILKRKGGGVVIRATDWNADALPGLVCPNDDVTVSWDAGSTPCAEGTEPNCLTFTATSLPTIPSSPFASPERTGISNMGNINARTTFNFEVTRDPNPGAYTWEPKRDVVNYIFPSTSEYQFPIFEAVCNPDGIYDSKKFRLNMDSPEFLQSSGGYGQCVQIVSICNNVHGSVASMPITLHSLDGSLPLTTLARGDCVEDLNLDTNLTYEVNLNSSEPIVDITPKRCLGTVTDPATTYRMQFIFSCDIESDECM